MLNPKRSTKRLLSLWSIPALLPALVLSAPALAQEDPAVSAEVKKEGSGDAEASDPEKEDKPDPFPLSANIGLDTSFGSGFLPPAIEPAQPYHTTVPYIGQSLSTGLAYRLPTFDGALPKMSLSTGLSASITWLDTIQNPGFSRIMRVSDLNTGLAFPGLYTEDVTGLSMSARLGWRAPLSLNSRRNNTISAFSAGGSVAWNTGKLDLPEWLGTFNISFAPGVSVAAYSQNAPSLPCDASSLDDQAVFIGNAVERLELIPLVVTRETEILENGECKTSGRQSLARANVGLSAGWSLKKHSVNASLGLSYSFLRPNANAAPPGVDPNELSGLYASGQDWSELTSGSLSYSYSIPTDFMNLPVDTNASLTAGVSSMQPAYGLFCGDSCDPADPDYVEGQRHQTLRFPFWDFVTPSNNFSAAFVALSVGI
jgi:hypothetical protein